MVSVYKAHHGPTERLEREREERNVKQQRRGKENTKLIKYEEIKSKRR